jgi:hypothetical protein
LTGKQHWRNTKPLPHEPTTKTVDGSTWHYCTHHQAWGRHTTEECIKRPFTTVSNQVTATASMAHIGIQDIQVCENELCASASMAQLANNTHHSGTLLYHKAHKTCTAVKTMCINQAKQLYASLEGLLGLLTTTWSFLCVTTPYLIVQGTNVANTFLTFQANHSTHNTTGLQYDTDSFLLGIDNHASASMTNTEDDFVGPTKTVDIKIKGIKGYLSTAKVGTVRWTLQDDQGRNHQFNIPGTYLVPDLPIRLLSPQHLAQEMFKISNEPDGTACHTYSDRVVLTWNHGKYCQTITLDKANVPIIRTSPSYNNYNNYISTLKEPPQPLAYTANFPMVDTSDMPVMDVRVPLESSYNDEVPHNVSPSNLLMIWHVRLGHIPFQRIQQMAANGDLPGELRKLSTPRCISCMFGKATKIPWRVKGMPNSHIKPTTHPGQCVSIDQMESSTPGLVAQMKGIPTTQRYKYATVIVDHYSRYTYVHMHTNITSEQTMAAKHAFELMAKGAGVQIKHYHADNGRFADNAFLKDVELQGQTITFCGVRAHFQNGIAEKRIRDLQERARTMLIHASNKWPKAMNASLWPYAMRLACNIDNHTYDKRINQSRVEAFMGVAVRPNLRHFHTFGCPAYVLTNSQLKGVGKWEPRAHVGIYLGPSPRHARSVHLILNPLTGLVSPQYHVKFDELFETVPHMHVIPKWTQKCHLEAPQLSVNDTTGSSPHDALNQEEPMELPNTNTRADDSELEANTSNNIEPAFINDHDYDAIVPHNPPDEIPEMPEDVQRSRYGRKIKPTERAIESQALREAGLVSYSAESGDPGQNLYTEDDPTAEMDHPLMYLYKASSDPDTLTLLEALKAPDAIRFKEAMVSEVNEHNKRHHWKPVLKTSLPDNTIILPAVWAMRRKRRIDSREVYKWKSRLNLGGHKMVKGIHYHETYSPVVAWQNIRLFLILTALNKWHTTQIDFVMAYTQAPMDKPVYMHLPPGVNLPGLDRSKHCLQVLKNIYGGKDSGRIWFHHLRHHLVNVIGYTQSTYDECVFYYKTTIFVVYTDDGILFDPSELTIQNRIKDIQKYFEIEIQGNLQDYLGIHIKHHNDGTIIMSQPHLIDSILSDLNLLPSNIDEKRKATCKPLPSMPTRKIHADPNGPPFAYPWHYRAIIGKLNFLEKSTRPDITYVVHQLARFSTKLKQSHGHAVKHLGRYLLGTRNRGLILQPQRPITLTCYVDADFCGTWDPLTAPNDPDTARSRSGFIVFLAGAPLFWQSKLQSMIALSTAESELIALSEASKFVKSMTYLIDELHNRNIIISIKPNFRCQIFEDNAAALEISKIPKVRPRTRHINVLYHHFRSEAANNRVTIEPIKSCDNVADILTKQQNASLFHEHRLQINGW